MTKTLAFLHTAQPNADLFQAMAEGLPLEHSHMVRGDLLARAVDAGQLTPDVQEETEEVLRALSKDADAVVLTCSTLGAAADALTDLPVMRIDRALAEAAVKAGKRIAVLVTVESTMGPTGDLFSQVAEPAGATVDVRLLEGLFASFLSGDTEAYFDAVAAAADDLAGDYDVIAFGQASMAPAADRCQAAKPLVSTVEGLAAARAMVS